MENISESTTRVFAALGAAALTLTLLVSSFSTPQASIFAGMLA